MRKSTAWFIVITGAVAWVLGSALSAFEATRTRLGTAHTAYCWGAGIGALGILMVLGSVFVAAVETLWPNATVAREAADEKAWNDLNQTTRGPEPEATSPGKVT